MWGVSLILGVPCWGVFLTRGAPCGACSSTVERHAGACSSSWERRRPRRPITLLRDAHRPMPPMASEAREPSINCFL